ncbi:MAG: glycosyltransferase family 39 protein, partial [Lachnospiraceae bacterium]|nr:glycosyltransferase family 39 protein [Lachnospiraceae bacterium]
MKKVWKIIDTDHLYIGLILLIAVLTRCVGFGIYPGGVHVDEAFSGYEAWSMLNYGTDSWGYHNPVYLTAWGSGMNVMNSLLIIPFIRIWGLSEITIRMPQVLIGLISVYIFYLLLLRVENKNTALLGSFFLAVSPWHIMMSRWGLEGIMAPALVVIS